MNKIKIKIKRSIQTPFLFSSKIYFLSFYFDMKLSFHFEIFIILFYVLQQEDKKTYFFNRTLTDEEIEEIGTNINGYEIWKKYTDILKEENYAKKIVELSKIREKMMYFLYELKKDVELNYNDIKGSIIYIDDGDKYFTDGVYNGGEGDMFI